ncbi:hypothetical protein D3C86_1966470 [compost metagenome]
MDQHLVLDELAGNISGRLKQAASVIPQVNHQGAEIAFLFHCIQACGEHFIRIIREAVNTEIAYAAVQISTVHNGQ